MNKINLNDKLTLIKDHWNPRIVGELNGQYLKLVKFIGPFSWHHHETEDEMFLVVKGRFCMEFREDGREEKVWLEEGEFIEYVGPGSDGIIAQVVYEFSAPQPNRPVTKEAAERWLSLLAD